VGGERGGDFSWLMKCTQIDIGYKRDSQHAEGHLKRSSLFSYKKKNQHDITDRLLYKDILPFNKTF